MLNLNKILLFFVLIICFFLFGIFYFFIQRDYLIIHFNLGSNKSEEAIGRTKENISLRKKVNFYYWKNDRFYSEEKVIVWGKNPSENLKHLINSLLSFMQEERILEKRVYVDCVALSQDDQIFFSFDCNPLEKEWSVFKKWNFIESILKTINCTNLNFRSVNFLVNHQTLQDDHLDFSAGWPLEGFLQQ